MAIPVMWLIPAQLGLIPEPAEKVPRFPESCPTFRGFTAPLRPESAVKRYDPNSVAQQGAFLSGEATVYNCILSHRATWFL